MSLSGELLPGENVIKTIKPSRWAYLFWYIIGVLLLFPTFIGIIIIIIAELVRNGTNYHLTNKRIIHDYTLLSRKVSSTSYKNVQDLYLTQGMIDRIIGIGNIHINTAGTHVIEIVLKGVKNPIAIKRLIDKKIIKIK